MVAICSEGNSIVDCDSLGFEGESWCVPHHGLALSDRLLLLGHVALGLADVGHDAAEAALLLPQNDVASLRAHRIELLSCTFASIQANLLTDVSRLGRQMLQERDDVIQGSIVQITLELG